MYDIACDFPSCEDTFARVLLETFNTSLKFEFNDIVLPSDVETSEEGEFIIDFHKEVLNAVLENLYQPDGAYNDLRDVVLESDLKAYGAKIKFEDEIKKP